MIISAPLLTKTTPDVVALTSGPFPQQPLIEIETKAIASASHSSIVGSIACVTSVTDKTNDVSRR
jgi:hypothetical protein